MIFSSIQLLIFMYNSIWNNFFVILTTIIIVLKSKKYENFNNVFKAGNFYS